jgi:uncharacterized OB-fold protein
MTHPTQHIYAKCFACGARWWAFTLPTAISNFPKKVVCPNCYERGKWVVVSDDSEQSEHKPERKP